MRAYSGESRLAVAGLCFIVMAGTAHADDPVDSSIDVQLFEGAIGPRSFITVTDTQLATPRQLSLDFLITYLTNPFVIKNFDEGAGESVGERTAVVEDVVAGQLSGAYGITPRLQLGASLPLIFRMTGEGLDTGSGMSSAEGLRASGLGDLLVEGKVSLLRQAQLGLAATAGLTLPTSFGTDGGDYLGDDLPSLRGRLAADWRPSGRLALGTNVGLIGRKAREIYDSTVGSQLVYGAAMAVNLTTQLTVVGELFGRTGVTAPNLAQSPLEAEAGVRVQATSSIAILVGGGGGVVEGIGAPGVRVFASASWAPDTRDNDGDGVPNSRDQCPILVEDHDGDHDSDGCPDDDIDGDRRADGDDECPTVAEDIDGFADDDGCPELDNDSDKISDLDDRCPNDREDGKPPFNRDGCPAGKRDSDDDGIADDTDACPEETEDDDGFEDWDGCSEDNDKDGLADGADRCPLCPEDLDGKTDDDGCPDLDDDADGVADATDRCPTEVETANGIDDFDGCPDSGGRQTSALDGNRLSFSRPLDFDRRGGLVTPADVDPLALVMLAHPEVTTWRLVVAAKPGKREDETRARSQAQADALKARLVERGVEAGRLEALGAVADKPTVAVVATARVDPAAEEPGARDAMCPTNLRAVPRARPEASAPVLESPAPAATPAATPAAQPAAQPPAAQPPAAKPAAQPAAKPAAQPAAPAPVAADADRDGDQVVDRLDNCPEQAGDQANAGCTQRQLVQIADGKIELLDKIQFEGARVRSASRALLDNVAAVILARGEATRVRIEGHTDDQGDAGQNLKLSQRRADAVVAYLVKKGVPRERLEAVGHGESKPAMANDTPAGRAANQRIEFVVVTP